MLHWGGLALGQVIPGSVLWAPVLKKISAVWALLEMLIVIGRTPLKVSYTNPISLQHPLEPIPSP
jgi:hypothetical protein